MKQIVLQDEDFKELLNSLQFEKFKEGEFASEKNLGRISSIHRKFCYTVTRWAQKHGADTI